jgi:hypothetical protein
LYRRKLLPLRVSSMEIAAANPPHWEQVRKGGSIRCAFFPAFISSLMTRSPTGIPPADTVSCYDDAKHNAFIRRHHKAWARSPCRKASAYILDHTVFARSRDPHDVEAHCRFVEKPRGTDR